MNRITIDNRHKEIIGMSLIVLGLFIMINYIFEDATVAVFDGDGTTGPFGELGYYISYYTIPLLGKFGSFCIPIYITLSGWIFFSKTKFKEKRKIYFYILWFSLLGSLFLGVIDQTKTLYLPKLLFPDISYDLLAGSWGVAASSLVIKLVGSIFSYIVTVVLLLSAIINIFNTSLYDSSLTIINLIYNKSIKMINQIKYFFTTYIVQLVKKINQKIRFRKISNTDDLTEDNDLINYIDDENKIKGKDSSINTDSIIEKSNESPEDVLENKSIEEVENKENDIHNKKNTIDNEPITIDDEVMIDKAEAQKIKSKYKEYKIPSVDLLTEPVEISSSLTKNELYNKGEQLIHSLRTFGVEGKLVRISPGPIITLYEVEPAEGVKVNKFTNLSDDLARVMQAQSIRIIAPIPGTSSVGIELPNAEPATVYFKSIINSSKFSNSESKLTIALGKDTIGDAFVFDLGDMPHLLVAGATGSGKSVGINTIISSILFKAKPDEVKFILIDPKKLELATYKSLVGYHLITAPNLDEYVMTTPDNALAILDSAITEMERRFQVFADARVRDIKEYHSKNKLDPSLENIPYIVVIIDELADIMMTSSKAIEEPITRLAQKARAVGIHLVVATQRPSVDVITGLIKSNFPARISYKVSTRDNSKIIIDQMGAEKLLGRGDLLFRTPTSSSPIRIHNAFLSLDEIENIMEDISNQPKPNEMLLPQSIEKKIASEFDISGEQDDLLQDAAELVVAEKIASVSMLQRRFKIGYSRAGRLVDELEALGIVSGYSGSKARDVLVDEAYIANIFNSE